VRYNRDIRRKNKMSNMKRFLDELISEVEGLVANGKDESFAIKLVANKNDIHDYELAMYILDNFYDTTLRNL